MPKSLLALLAGLFVVAGSLAPALAQQRPWSAAQAASSYGPPPSPVPSPGETARPAAAPAAATTPAAGPDSPEVRRQVSGAHALSAASTCFYGPHIDQGQAKRLCRYQARGKLLDTAASQLAGDPAVARAGLSGPDLRAFVDSLLAVSVTDEEVRPVPDGLAVRLTLRAETEPGTLEQRLASFAGNPELRAAALAETAVRDRQAGEARMAAVPFGADREFRAKEIENEMGQDAAFAERRLVPGMSIKQVKELLGDPAAVKQAVLGPESYLCASYGRIWVVFRDGVVSCLRSRLDYVRRYDTDCHCAGNYSTILKND
ncbi:hypothetical protein [Desulfovibrio sp. TomC]|uniref:hypothetical protein n=1 Tax=Desulfovibrio sp. TomC TaxID=1562888 RepID=UPI000574935C|nr:hypothetical protein [Desulfovibrio sp. TomC]KHK01378.1 hypothetical protein NY78_3132 [Desulfovibrio sp. TomC]